MGQVQREWRDPVDTAVVLSRGIWIIVGLIVLNSISAVVTDAPPIAYVIYAGVLAMLALAAVALRRGHVRSVAIGLVSGLFLAVTVAVTIFGGLRSGNALNAYLVVIVMAGLVWSVRAGLVMALLVAVSTAVLGILDAQDALPTVSTIADQELLALWTGFALNVALTGGILYLAVTRLRSSAEESQRSEQRLAALVDGAPDGILVVDREAKILSANPAAARLIGRSAEVLLGSSLLESLQGSDADRQAVSRSLERAHAGEMVSNVELAAAPPERGSPVELVLSPFVSDDDTPVLLVTLHDQTERQRSESERSLLEEQLRLAQKMEAVGKLAGGVAHDFNNLLTVILGHGEELLDRLRSQPDLHEQAETIQDAAGRAAALTRQLLAFSRRQPAQNERFDLNELVREMERMLGRMVGEQVDLQLELDGNAAWVSADPSQVEQVIANLIVNAHDAMAGGGRITIRTERRTREASDGPGQSAAGKAICLIVEDEGSGIAPEVRERMFDPFFTTKEVGHGTGLGLATVHGIVQQSGGEIHVESSLGHGTRFEICLPEVLEGVESPPAAAPPRLPIDTDATILVVEDELGVRRFISRALAARGYRTIEAEDGEAALRVLETTQERIDAVLTDVRMPNLGGIELVRRLRERWPGVRVLLMSGYPEDDHGERHEPAFEVLAKPFRASELVERLSEVLSR